MYRQAAYLFFRALLAWERFRGCRTWSVRWAEYQGYRRAAGCRWGLWETNAFPGEPLRLWWPSGCGHHPAPPMVNSTEPLATEDWTCERQK